MKIRDQSSYPPEKIVAIRKIIKLMDFWKISPHELRGVVLRAAKPVPAPEIRYRHPVTGLTWDGQGGQPQWLREALIREGYTVQELRYGQDVAGDDGQPGSASQDVAQGDGR